MLDLLLSAGDDVLERSTEQLEVSRLSKKLGQPFMITVKSLTLSEFSNAGTGDERIVHILLKGVTEPDLSSEALRKKFTPKERKTPLTPVELVKVLFLPGEIFNIYNAISDLSGFSDDAVAKIEKN